MEPRNIRRDKTGYLLAAVASLAFADGCSPAFEEGSERRGSARAALVASVPPQEGQAFLVGALAVVDTAEGEAARAALQQAAQSNHLELDIQASGANARTQTALLDRWQSRRVDAALFIGAFQSADAQNLLREATARQMPVVIAAWEEARPLALPAGAATAAPIRAAVNAGQAAPVTASNVTLPAPSVQGKRAASLTLLHNGKATRQMLTVTPQELCATAVNTVSAYLRGEKIKPRRKF